jgi:hypothetical protein
MVLKKGEKNHSKKHQQIFTKIHIPDGSVLTDPEISAKFETVLILYFLIYKMLGYTPYIQN